MFKDNWLIPKPEPSLNKLLHKNQRVKQDMLTQDIIILDSLHHKVLIMNTLNTMLISEVLVDSNLIKQKETQLSSIIATAYSLMTTGSGKWELVTTYTKFQIDFIDQTMDGQEYLQDILDLVSWWHHKPLYGKFIYLPELVL